MRAPILLLALLAVCHTLAFAATPNNVCWTGPPGMRLPVTSSSGVSSLWGHAGESFKPSGTLLDYSYAGYMAGEQDLPKTADLKKGAISIKKYGARGDGKSDDSKAFARVLDAVPADGGVVYLPAGTYVLTQQFEIRKRIVLVGDGEGKTILYFPKSLAEVLHNHKKEAFSYGGYFIAFKGWQWWGTDRNHLGDLRTGAKRGDTCVQVSRWSNPGSLKPGQWVSISLTRPNNGNFLPMNLGLDPGCDPKGYCDSPFPFSFASRVVSVSNGQLCLERPLPWDLYTNMPASFYRWGGRLAGAGVDSLTFKFAPKRYLGHFAETGQNGLEMHSVINGFVRNVTFINSDYAMIIQGSMFTTATDITLKADAARVATDKWWKGMIGHIGLGIISSMDCVYQRFDIQGTFVHDISIQKNAGRNVYTEGKGVDINLDHHRAMNYGNLFTDIDLGIGTRPFFSGGKGWYGPHCGPYSTFWHLTSKTPAMTGPEPDFGPALNLVGLGPLAMPGTPDDMTKTWLVEPDVVGPTNIFRAQQQARLSSPHKVSPLLGQKGNGGAPPVVPLK